MSKIKYNYALHDLLSVKSKFEADIIRFSLNVQKPITYEDFEKLLAERHNIYTSFSFNIWYLDPNDGDLLPINNNSNLKKALVVARCLLRIFILRKGEKLQDIDIPYILKRKGRVNSPINTCKLKSISSPCDFRQISSIIDIDIPKTRRRVLLLKHEHGKPLGFFVRNGPSFRTLPLSTGGGVEQVSGVFISRVVPGGLAESTGLLAVGDEVLEVNSIDVLGKTLEQVTDMMIANLSNLIITVKPVNEQLITKSQHGDSFSNHSQSQTSSKSHQTMYTIPTESDEEVDEIKIYHV